ncbi:uncharacterized protein [Epargyreus clarus]
MSLMEIKVALMEFQYVHKQRSALRELRRRRREANHQLCANPSYDEDEDDFDFDSSDDSDDESIEGTDGASDGVSNNTLAPDFKEKMVLGADGPNVSTVSSKESRPAGDVRKKNRLRPVYYMRFSVSGGNEENDPGIDSSYNSEFDDNESNEGSEKNQDGKRKIDDAKEQPGPSGASGEPKRQRLMVAEDA